MYINIPVIFFLNSRENFVYNILQDSRSPPDLIEIVRRKNRDHDPEDISREYS